MSNDSILGALVIATWINCILLMIETLQVYRTWNAKNRDKRTWWLVLWCYALDVLCSAMNCTCVYLYTVTHWGDYAYKLDQHWPLTTGLVCSGLVGITVQAFLILRYHSLSKNLYAAGFLAAMALASTGAAVAIGILLIRYSAYTERDKLTPPSLVWLAATSVTDWLIAGLLVWELRKRKNIATRRTDGMIHTLIVNAIRTGAVTSLLATSFLISYAVSSHSNISIGFGFCLGRVYSITLLYNINTNGGLSKYRQPSGSLTQSNEDTSLPGYNYHTWTNLSELDVNTARTLANTTEFSMTGTGTTFTAMSGSYRDEDASLAGKRTHVRGQDST
jgi:hypothetical protein